MKLMPIMGGILGFTAMASLGLPGLAGFWGEFMALVGSYNPLEGLDPVFFRTMMVIGAVGTVLTAGHEFHDVNWFEAAAWAPLLIAIVAIGVFPRIVFGATNDAVVSLVRTAFGG